MCRTVLYLFVEEGCVWVFCCAMVYIVMHKSGSSKSPQHILYGLLTTFVAKVNDGVHKPFFWKVNAVKNILDTGKYDWVLWIHGWTRGTCWASSGAST